MSNLTEINTDNSHIINEYVPYVVGYILDNIEPPKDREELIQFSQALVKHVLKRVVPIKEN